MNHGSFAIEDALLTQILEAAEKAYPFECCGILLGSADGAVKEIKEVRNVVSGEKQRVGFSIDPLELY
ncbi:MAG: Mov34/MPN/PAD-1 family protein, partial [Thermoguttaceae bacterium]|nr:Mov34/MPN/PAD-1 family protein [Thermoguttaceae bacterium]